MITVSNDYEEPISPQNSLSDFSQDTTPFPVLKNSSHGSNTSLNAEMEVHEASSSALLLVLHDSKTLRKNKNSAPDSLKSPKKKYNTLSDPAF